MPRLDWIGRKAVEKHHTEVPFRLLKCDPKLSVGDTDSGNLLVEGDNLEALKALLPYYAGQVKCIYIDPPYNTGNENWVYNDNVNSPEIRKWLGKVVGKEAEDLSRHDKWLCMMYPRLRLLKRFLRKDGVMLISIDDNEYSNLQQIVTEIFGRNNILATLVWEKGKKGDSKFFSVTHEYIIAVALEKEYLKALKTKWRRKKPGVEQALEHYASLRKKHKNNHDEIRKQMMKWYRELSKGHPAKKHKHYSWSDDRGLYFPDNFHGPDDGRESRPRYDIIHPVTGRPCAKPSTGWRWEEDRTLQALAEVPPRIHFGPDETTIPCRKSYLEELDAEAYPSVFYKDGRAATLEVEQMLEAGAFPFPKDSDILSELLDMICGKNDLILDSFAGSGTTAHSILKLNNLDGGRRKFILVELDEDTCRTKTKIRIQRAITGYSFSRGKKKPAVEGLGGGFKYCKLGSVLFDATGQVQEEVHYKELAQHIFFIETGQPLISASAYNSPLIGISDNLAVYLLYNGVLKDKSPNGGNALTRAVLAKLPKHAGPKVIYGTSCRIGKDHLRRYGITFKQIPYEIKDL